MRMMPVSNICIQTKYNTQRCTCGISTAATSFKLNTLGYRKKKEAKLMIYKYIKKKEAKLMI